MDSLTSGRVLRTSLLHRPPPPGVVTARAPALDVARLAFLVAVLTASFDLFLALKVGGFTLRACQVLLAFPFAYVVGSAFTQQRIRVPIGGVALLTWTVFILAFVPNTPFVARSVGYAAWLLLDILVIVLAVQLFDDIRWLRILLRWYVMSFLVLSLVGVLQLLLGVAHLPAPFVKQWLIHGRWPRLNGFSYEPSYYATYLLLGWVFCAWLLEKQSDFLPKKLLRASFAAASVALFLSTSRLGWAMMILWGVGYAFRHFGSLKTLRLSLGVWILVFNVVVVPLGIAGGMAFYKSDRIVRFLAGGTGLFGTAAHSVDERQGHLQETLALVKKSPFVGYSLGGIAPAIGEDKWESITNNEAAKTHEGMSVFIEVLAASGIIGFIPFAAFIFTIFIKPIQLARRAPEPLKNVMLGLLWAMAIEFIVLQFNQNILRPYLWFHIAIVSAAYVAIREHLMRDKRAVPDRA